MNSGIVGIQITTQPIVVAPAPIWLEATNPTGFTDELGNPMAEPSGGEPWDPTYHNITYIWTVEEETSPGVWTQMSGSYPRVINMVTGWNEAYVAYGKRVAFRLPDAGTYRFKCWCVDMQGNMGEATSSPVTVQAVTQAFSASNTIVFAQDGDFTGAPANSAQVSTIGALNAEIESRTSTETRISFKPGEIVTDVDIVSDFGHTEYIDTWVVGTQTEWRGKTVTGASNSMYAMTDSSPNLQQTFRDIVFAGTWDDRFEVGDTGNASVFETRFTTVPTKYLVYNCDFRGLGVCWLTLGDGGLNSAPSDRRWMIADCIVTSFRNYGFYSNYCNGGEYDFLGSSMYRNHDALHGPNNGAKLELRNDHCPLRLQTYKHCYIAVCDFFNNAGWSAPQPSIGPSNNGCVRIFASDHVVPQVPSLIVDRCVAEGGYSTWKHDGQDGGVVEVPGNWLYDKVLTLCTSRTHHPWNIAMGGTTRRNCYTWAPNVNYWDRGTGFDRFLRYETDGSSTPASNFTTPMLDYNNTELSVDDGNEIPLSDGLENQWSNYLRENSVHHQPHSSNPTTSFAPINTDPVVEAVPGVTPRFSGVRYNYALIVVAPGTIPNGSSFTIPYSEIDSTDGLGRGNAKPTDQAYWQALPASDNQHAVSVDGGVAGFLASRGDFTVSYNDPTNIVITNTSGFEWSGGNIVIHLDRKSRLATDIPPLTQYESPGQVPLPRPQANSSALGAADIGYVAYDDFLGEVRSTPKTAGAVEA